MLFLGALVSVGGLVALLLAGPPELDGRGVAIWLICLGAFVLADAVGNRMERGLWAGYLNLAAAVAWLTLGTAPGLAVVVIGAFLTPSLRLVWKIPQRSSSRIQTLRLIFGRIIISGLSLLGAAFFFDALGGTTPVQSDQSLFWMPLGFSLVSGFVLTYIIGLALTGGGLIERSAVFSFSRMLHELLLLLLTAVLPLIAINAGALVFAVIMALLVAQALRFYQVEVVEQSLTRRVHELSLLNKVGEVLSSNFNLDDMLFNIYKQVEQLVGLSIFYVAFYDKEEDSLDYRLVVAGGQQVKWTARKLSDGATERVIRTKQPVRIRASDRSAWPVFGTGTPSSSYLTFVGLPLLSAEDVFGVMAVLSSESEDAFGDEEFNTLQTIASQAGMAVRNALLFAQRAEFIDSLSHINEMTSGGLDSTDRTVALESACQAAVAITKAARAAIFLDDPETNQKLQLAFGLGVNRDQHDAYEMLAHRSVPDANEPRIVSNVADHPELEALAQQLTLRAFAGIPLGSNNHPVGILSVYHDQPKFYRKTELDFLRILANKLQAVLDNARFVHVLETYAYEMSQLVHLSRISTASLELNRVARDIADLLRQMMNVHRVIIGLVEAEEQRVRILVSNVAGDSLPTNTYLSLEKFGELQAMMKQDVPEVAVFSRQSPTLSSELQSLMDQAAEQSLVLMPIVADHSLVAIAALGSLEPRSFPMREIQFIEMAANQIAAQIKNALVYEQTQRDLNRRLEQVALVEDIAKQVSSSLDFNQIISSVVEAALRATQGDIAALGLKNDSQQLWVMEQRYVAGSIQKTFLNQPADRGIIGQTMQSGRPVLSPDHRLAADYITDFPGIYHSSVAVPLIDDEKTIGALNVESGQENFFNDEHIRFLSSLADHAVTSIRNARYLEERQHEIDMLTSLRALSLWLATADDTRSVAEAVLRTALQLLDGQDGVIYRYEEAPDRLTVLARLWPNEQGNARAERLLPEAVALHTLREGNRQIIPDVSQHSAAQPDDTLGYKSAIVIPIKRGLRVRSVIFITFPSLRVFHERELNTIDLLASQTIGHLENATLHERIRAARDQMRAILDSTRDGMILLDRSVMLIAANPSAQNLIGIDLEEHIGEYFPDTLLNYIEDRRDSGYSVQEVQNMARVLRLEPELSTRRRFYHEARNQMKFIEEVGSPVLDENGQIVGRLLVLRDITEEKLLNEYRAELTHMMVHDLRGPLNAIINGFSSALAILDSPDLIDDVRILLNASLFSANRLLGLVNSLLEIAAMEGSSLQLKPTPISVASLVETAFMSLAISIQQADIKMRFDLPGDLPLVMVDREKIERVLINLLDNALRFTPASSEILIAAQVLEQSYQVQIKIADSGPGIPVSERTRIFDRFRRIKGQEPLRGSKGSGLGLTFCRMAVEAHGGRIRVEEESPLPGACFSFTVPISHEIPSDPTPAPEPHI